MAKADDATLTGITMQEGMNFASIATVVLSLILVLMLAYAATRWLAKRPFMGGGSRSIRIVERLPIDRTHSILIVQIGERRLMIGVAPSGIALIAELRADELAPIGDQAASGIALGAAGKPPWIQWAEGIGRKIADKKAQTPPQKAVFRIPEPTEEDAIGQLSSRIRQRSQHFDATRKDDDPT